MSNTDTEYQRLVFNLRSAKWQFAKTMPHIPHFYTVGKNWDDQKEFIWTANSVLKFSILRKILRIPWNYFHLDGWVYWVMDKDPNDAQIINRARDKQ